MNILYRYLHPLVVIRKMVDATYIMMIIIVVAVVANYLAMIV